MRLRKLFGVALATSLVAVPIAAADRDASRAALARGLRSLGAHELSTARIELMNAVKADPGYSLARIAQARVLIELGDGFGAGSALDRAVELGADRNQVRHLIAHSWVLRGDPDKALAEADAAQVPPKFAAYAARVRALAHLDREEIAEAAAAFDEALRQTPNDSELWADVGEFRLATGDQALAIDAANRALKIDPRNIDALMLSGTLVRSQYGLVAAIPWFQRALVIDPNHVPALVALAATQGDAGQNRAMLATTRKLLSIDGRNPHAFYFQAVMAARAQKTELARALLQRTGDRLDGEPGVMMLDAILDMQSGAPEQAIAKLKPMVAAQPPNIKLRRLLGSAMWQAGDAQGAIETLMPLAARNDADTYVLSIVGRAYESLGDRARSLQFLERAARPLVVDPQPYPPGQPSSVKAERDATNVVPMIARYLGTGQAGAALAEAQRVQADNPGAPAAHVLVGDALSALGRHREAITAYQRAANIAFTEPTAMRLVRAYGRAGDGVGALKVLDLYLAQNPRSISARVAAADYFIQTGQWDSAIQTLEAVRARIGNRDAIVLNNLANAYLQTGKSDLATAYARAAYAMNPNSPVIVGTYGWALHKRGRDADEASALLRKAARLAPADGSAKFRLGQALASTGKRGEAKTMVTAALATPGFRDRKAAEALLSRL